MGVDEHSILSIPIYRCSFNHFRKEFEKEKVELLKYFISTDGNKRLADEGYDFQALVDRSMDNKWYSWKYNEIVGYIDIIFWSNQIRGILYKGDRKRLRKGFKRIFLRRTSKLFQISTLYLKSNDELYKNILSTLESLHKDYDWIDTHYLGLEEFKKTGPFIDWLALIRSFDD